jgi:EAL domain-containing protein (putative c-di-GMP-specific phosphodiesterase class I)
VETLLRERALDPRRLCVELTESAIMADPEQAAWTLNRLVATGVGVSIDDFGTGHSSLAYLRHLPVSELKVDRSFVDGIARAPQDRVIVEAAIQLGHSFGLTVVAEGVESAPIDSLLRALGCDQAQGFLYGRPQPAAATTALLTASTLEAA